MVVLLPGQVDGLADLESKLTLRNLQWWMRSANDGKDVKVYLPKFKTTSAFEMSSTLRAMGMVSAFDSNSADFSRMTGDKDVFLSEVIHKAFVDVHEEGTEAAAATAVGLSLAAMDFVDPTEPPIFRADHPFVFMIRDNRHGGILFLGRINNPLE